MGEPHVSMGTLHALHGRASRTRSPLSPVHTAFPLYGLLLFLWVPKSFSYFQIFPKLLFHFLLFWNTVPCMACSNRNILWAAYAMVNLHYSHITKLWKTQVKVNKIMFYLTQYIGPNVTISYVINVKELWMSYFISFFVLFLKSHVYFTHIIQSQFRH